MTDVYEILKNLEYRAVGIDPKAETEMREGFFCAFRTIGLPIRFQDFASPTPFNVAMPKITKVDGEVLKAKTPEGNTEDGLQKLQIDINPDNSLLNTYLITNDKLKLNPLYQVEPSTSGISQTWEAIINSATLNYNPSALSADKKKLYEELNAELDNIQPKYNEYYEKHQQAKKELFMLYAKCKADTLTGPEEWNLFGVDAQRKVDTAFEQLGQFKGQFDKINAILNSDGQDPASFFISKAKTNFNNWLKPISISLNIPYTKIIPEDWYNSEASGWTKFESSKLTSSTIINNSKVEAGGKTGFSIGFWSVEANASYGTDKKDAKIEVDNLEITFEYAIADIKRPWLDTSLLNANNWYMKSDDPINVPYHKNCISNGTFKQNFEEQNKNIFLPSVVTSLILVKNLKISWKSGANHISSLNEVIKGGGSVGWGPFNLGGSYGRTKEESNAFSETNTQSLSVDGVQLIGYVSEILPASPFLDSK